MEEGRPPVKARKGAVERSLHVIEVLTEAAAPMGIAAIAQATGLEANTVHRLVERLAAAGYVRKNIAAKRYRAGAQALFPKSLYHPLNGLRQDSREQLRQLRERHNESVCLIVYIGNERVIVDFIQGREPLSPLYGTRLRNPLNASAAGIILLNELPKAELRALLGEEPFAAPTIHTVTTHRALEKAFAALRTNGYAIARETTFVGVNAVAAPVRGPQKLIGCLAFTGSTQTITEARLAVLGEALKDSANLISWGAPSAKAVTHFLGL